MIKIEREQKIPDGPPEAFDSEMDLRVWIENNFRCYSEIYRHLT